MVFGILGSYLEKKGLVTDVQLRNVLAEQQKVRVKLGLIAVAEGFMTKEQADRVNLLQSQVDMKFGDIAVKEGYLTFGQVDTLIRKQGNPYLAFAQALDNLGFMSYEKLEAYVEEFKKEYSLTDSDIDDIKRDDMDRIIPIFLPNDSSEYANLAGIAFRTIMRCVDFEAAG